MPPSLKVTVPLGVPLTVAVKVTDCPTVDGFKLDVTAVVVPTRFTVCVSATDVLPATVLLPP